MPAAAAPQLPFLRRWARGPSPPHAAAARTAAARTAVTCTAAVRAALQQHIVQDLGGIQLLSLGVANATKTRLPLRERLHRYLVEVAIWPPSRIAALYTCAQRALRRNRHSQRWRFRVVFYD